MQEPVFISGVAETALGKVEDQSELSMAMGAARQALAEAGMTLSDVDALFTNYMPEVGADCGAVRVGEYLGIQPRYAECSDMGGAAFEFFVHHAMLALAAGRCECALILYASRQRSRRNRPRGFLADGYSITSQFEQPYGLVTPISQYALVAARHMYEYGTTAEQLARVAVSARKWAALNPKAWARAPLTVDQVLASPLICEPLHQLDCCLVTDGGGALVLTNMSRARNAAKKAIRVIGVGESQCAYHVAQIPDLTTTPGSASARAAFAMSGVTPHDIDVFEPYDNFTSSVISQLEDVGICEKGEGGAFVEEGHTEPGGTLPTSTMGGGLSYCHPGALGLLLLIETVRQLRGEAGDRQVPGAEVGVAHGIGGPAFSTSATVILGRD
ncbi:MAG TPA: acetyl-CoA acetyltransferase [Steroidobacteraceae bacterium]|nr:acetyl-CoA acetyltransferase [Steroidobacteraceae bacterium]